MRLTLLLGVGFGAIYMTKRWLRFKKALQQPKKQPWIVLTQRERLEKKRVFLITLQSPDETTNGEEEEGMREGEERIKEGGEGMRED